VRTTTLKSNDTSRATGKLKVFLGYAPGVGKSYAMLDGGRQRLREGVDVVVGALNGVTIAEALEQAAPLHLVPPRSTPGAVPPGELDLPALLQRAPALVLIDDLAHANPAGVRNASRFIDVEELLAAGIGVYTTLNVQNLASLSDVVAQITGVTVQETVPDYLLDEADEIEYVDIPPAELLRRVEEGKVRLPASAQGAAREFYRPGNLAALREMTLRQAALRVDEQMRSYMAQKDIAGPWPASERVLVCLGANPQGSRLVRAGRRLAAALDAEWFVVHVDIPGAGAGAETRRESVAHSFRLAEELGARTVLLPGADVAETIARFARTLNITRIVCGKEVRTQFWDLLRPSTADRIIRKSGLMEVSIISTPPDAAVARSMVAGRSGRPPIEWGPYANALGSVAAATVLGLGMRSMVAASNLVMLFLLAVVISALHWGRGPAVVAATTSVLAFDFLFVPPHLTLAVSDGQYLFTFVGLMVVGLVVSTLATRARAQTQSAERRAADNAVLYDLSVDLASAGQLPEIMHAVIKRIGETFTREAALFLSQKTRVELGAASSGFVLTADTAKIAEWVWRTGTPAGRGTATFSDHPARFLPLRTASSVVGVLAVLPTDPAVNLAPDQRRLLDAFASQAAVAIERSQLAEAAGKARMLEAAERLQTALLNSISHDLRTPLASITGVLSSLRDREVSLDRETQEELLDDAYQEAERLNHLVGNLLNMTRLEGGALRVNKIPAELSELVGTALAHMGNRLSGRELVLDISDELPLVPLDFALMMQVLVNVLENAGKYSLPKGKITIRAVADAQNATLEVSDEGPGVPAEDLPRIFEKFYRVPRAGTTEGTGLGLSICKGIVEAHDGQITALVSAGGGMTIRIVLPLVADLEET
jgi:two-component system, OmpR family, sensor histidine kinase KdpD